MSTYIDTDCHIRWMIRRDIPEVLRIENASFEFAWAEEEFIRVQRQRNCIGMVAEVCELIAGYVIYELTRNGLRVLNFAVRPDCRRRSIGSLMVNKLKSKLNDRRTKIELHLRESNLVAQKFFAANGFKAIGVVRGFYTDWSGEDAYLFRHQHREACTGK